MVRPERPLEAEVGTMNDNRVPIARPDLGRKEMLNLNECMASGWITQGKFVKEAEARLREITGRKYVTCVSSGTSALIVALLAIQPQSAPILLSVPWRIAAPALTFAAVHHAIRLIGGTVHRQAADPATWQVPKREWEVKKWEAAIVAPCYGKIDGSDVAVVYASLHDYPLIEDASESFGGVLMGKPAGSFGDISCLSFYANKICTAGEGGAVLTDNPELDRDMRRIANNGIDNRHYLPTGYGLNARMTDLHAAILCGQLERMPKMLERRNQILQRYMEGARRWETGGTAAGEVRAPWLFAGVHPESDQVWYECEKNNIEVRPFFPIITGTDPEAQTRLAETRQFSKRGLCLPLSSALTDEEVERVAEVIRS